MHFSKHLSLTVCTWLSTLESAASWRVSQVARQHDLKGRTSVATELMHTTYVLYMSYRDEFLHLHHGRVLPDPQHEQ